MPLFWHHRPVQEHPEAEVDKDWEDNPVSNSMAYFSDKLVPARWCNDEDHWSVRIASYLWTDCACCLLIRGACLVIAPSFVLGLMLGYIIF